MDSIRVRAALCLGVCLSVFAVLCQGQMASENGISSEEGQNQMEHITRDLAEALQGLLDGAQDNRIILEKKASVIPRCDVGERCAMKHGPRIGRLCDCLRGTACNSFFLRCY
ncbi:hypothetical protein COCON_G00126500 [Conger conger]|uniref:Cocaine- and amphetamine-regulated transcript protein n=1 Tax=Conger conger TaxID=82655 RepID=A0A9Q1DCZ2_CONCO|nr:cocaine- and amphetamine-regulated transcript 4 [Conger conger]KAJ8267478.1 hypothetical protein COCON_G00126500 [Conger conger]